MSGIPIVNLSEERKKELYDALMNPKPEIPYNPGLEDSGNKKYPRMDLTILVKGDTLLLSSQLEEKAQEEFARLFGIEYNFFKRIFNFLNSNRHNSEFFTRDEIAQILLKNNLVGSMEHGLQEVDNLLKIREIGRVNLREYKNNKGEKKYRFDYDRKRYSY